MKIIKEALSLIQSCVLLPGAEDFRCVVTACEGRSSSVWSHAVCLLSDSRSGMAYLGKIASKISVPVIMVSLRIKANILTFL